MRRIISLIGTFFALSMISSIHADESCSASNGDGNQTCRISCAQGQSAQCTDAQGSGAPTCQCLGDASKGVVVKKVDTKRFEKYSASAQAPIQNTNLVDAINSKLATLPVRHIDDECHKEVDPKSCRDIGGHGDYPGHTVCGVKQVCTPIMAHLTVSKPLLVSKGPSVVLSAPDWNNIPSEIFVSTGIYNNCTTSAQQTTFTHEEDTTVGTVITKTKSLETGNTQTTTINASYKSGANIDGFSSEWGINGGVSFGFNSKATITSSDQDSYTILKKNTSSEPVNIPPSSQVTWSHTLIHYHLPVPYTGTVTVDGQLGANQDKLTLLSSVLPNESDRTFDFAGVIVNSDSFSEKTSLQQVPCKPNL